MPAVAGIAAINVRNTLPILPEAVKPAKAVYYVESALICGELIEVDYTLNDKWLTFSFELQALKNFVYATGLNDYCYDRSDYAGEHVQDSGIIEMDTYIDENVECAVKAYLQAGKVGQYHVN
jgi:hypothetical protein